MPGPYDFIGQDTGQGWAGEGNWAKGLSLKDIFYSPIVMGIDLFARPLLYNPFAGPKALEKAMGATRWADFGSRAAKFSNAAVATPEHMQHYIMKMNAKELGTGPSRYAANVKGTLGADLATGEGMAARFGQSAATRMQFGRMVMGFSRFMLMFSAIDIGVSAIKSIAEAAGSYQRPDRPNLSRQLETGGVAFDTRSAQTQRQRSIQAIHNSQLSTRACMGAEASFLHLER